MKKYLRAYALLTLISGLVIAVDQYTKYLVRMNLELWTDRWVPIPGLEPYFRILHIPNKGSAFGLFQGAENIFKFLPIVVAVIIIVYYPQIPKADWPLRLALGLQLGGALGNWIDRLTVGYVVDFISVGNFPVFNVADACITIGVGVLLLGVIMQEQQERKHKEAVLADLSSPITQEDE